MRDETSDPDPNTEAGLRMVACGKRLLEGPFDERNAEMFAPTKGGVVAIERQSVAGLPPAIDAAHLARQRAFSQETFGPGPRTLGVIHHIRKELEEIEADPLDLAEWVDVIILAFDGAWRAGWEPQQILNAIKAKQAENEHRTWPDWRTASPDHAIEHVQIKKETTHG